MTDSDVDEDDAAFAALVRPLTLQQFRVQHWERRALHLPGAPDRFSGLGFGPEQFFAAAADSRALKVAYREGAEGAHRELSITGAMARSMFAAGMTVCLADAERQHAPLGRYTRGAKRSLSLAGDTRFNCYLSPAQSGFGLHFDDRSVFVLQLTGRKRFRFSAGAACRTPQANVVATPEGLRAYRGRYPWSDVQDPQPAGMQEVVLAPGDLLYLPAGAWHAGQAESDVSLGATLNCEVYSFWRLVQPLLPSLAGSAADLLSPLPVFTDEDLRFDASVPETLSAQLERAAHELAGAVARLDRGTLLAAWRSAVDRGLSRRTSAEATSETELSPDDWLELPRSITCFRRQLARASVLQVSAPGATVAVPVEAEPLIARLAQARAFRASEAMTWAPALTWEVSREILAALASKGLLRRRVGPDRAIAHTGASRAAGEPRS